MQDLVDADLAVLAPLRPSITAVLFCLGTNTVPAMPPQAQYEADLAYILDAMHTTYPAAVIYLEQTWRVGYNAESDVLAAWQGNVIAAGRTTWAKVGPNERAYLENGDNGATYMADEAHPNAAGYALKAARWNLTLLGY